MNADERINPKRKVNFGEGNGYDASRLSVKLLGELEDLTTVASLVWRERSKQLTSQ